MRYLVSFFVLVATLVTPAQADTFILPPADVDLVGFMQQIPASREETLLDIARRYDIGQNEILLANPDVDRWLPTDGSRVVLPTRYILPNAERTGLVLNLPEMRLYYYPKARPGETPVVITHPISVGRMDWETPLGMTKIVSKQVDPEWRPPQSIKDEHEKEGDPLPDVVRAGPDNPLGRYAIRMYPEDIEKVFFDIPVGTPVRIVNQPIKLGWLAGSLFIELHPPLEEDEEKYGDYMQSVLNSIADFLATDSDTPDINASRRINLSGRALRQAVSERSGIPVIITR
jgi:L,D-transpeptidase ErfK/SrfK